MWDAARRIGKPRIRARLAPLVLLAACAMVPRSGPPDAPLAPCPERPNCVSSEAVDARHRVGPLRLRLPAAQAWAAAQEAVDLLPRTQRLTTSPSYLHAISRTRLLRFVDDLELRLDVEGRKIDVRSASRVGYGDLGVNRRRVERLRAILRERGVVE